jgi:hypothetical protein
MLRLGYDVETIVLVSKGCHAHWYDKGLVRTTADNHEQDVRECIEHTSQDSDFDPLPGGQGGHRSASAEIELEQWQVKALRRPPASNGTVAATDRQAPATATKPVIQIQGHTNSSDHQTLMRRRLGQGLCQPGHETLVVEAILCHTIYERERGATTGHVALTIPCLIEIIERKHDVVLNKTQVSRVLERFASRQDSKGKLRPASHFELLHEVAKGKPGFPSIYEITGLALLLTEPPAVLAMPNLEGDAYDVAALA